MVAGWHESRGTLRTVATGSIVCAMATFAAAETYRPFVRLQRNALRAQVARPTRLVIDLPGKETWSEANIGQLQIRTFGRVESLSPADMQATRQLTHRFGEPGHAMLIAAVGPGSTKGKRDAIQRTQYCTKILLRIDPNPEHQTARAAPLKSPDMTAKVGLKVEVLPLIDPLTFTQAYVERGADLPIRAYFEGGAQAGATVVAIGPDGRVQRVRTGPAGIARVRIDRSGEWLIRYQKQAAGITYTGDLLFEAGVD